MQPIVAQYVAGVILLIFVFYVFSDPEGSVNILNGLGNFNTGAIAALQGRAINQAAGPARRRGR